MSGKQCPPGKVRAKSGYCVKADGRTARRERIGKFAGLPKSDRKPDTKKKVVKKCPPGKVRAKSGYCVKNDGPTAKRERIGKFAKKTKPLPQPPKRRRKPLPPIPTKSQMDKLPNEMIENIMLNMFPYELVSFCKSSKRINSICKSPVFKARYKKMIEESAKKRRGETSYFINGILYRKVKPETIDEESFVFDVDDLGFIDEESFVIYDDDTGFDIYYDRDKKPHRHDGPAMTKILGGTDIQIWGWHGVLHREHFKPSQIVIKRGKLSLKRYHDKGQKILTEIYNKGRIVKFWIRETEHDNLVSKNGIIHWHSKYDREKGEKYVRKKLISYARRLKD